MINSMEEWRDVVGYEGLYQVSDCGRIKSVTRVSPQGHLLKERIRSLITDKDGYLYVNLCKDGIVKTYRVHRLVGEAYIPNPNNMPLINHLNGIKNDNRVCNLEWTNNSGNMLHAFRAGLKHANSISYYGETNPHCKLSDEDCAEIKRLRAEYGYTHKYLAKMFNIGMSQIGRIIRGEGRNKGSVRIG